jgi:hypothetical protein
MNTRSTFALQSHLSPGTWLSHDRAYREYACEALARHEQHCVEIQNRWPVDLDQTINSRDYPELWRLNRERGQSSDTTRLYAAMSVEGFINFYGILRFGAAVYKEHFERLPIVPRLKLLLLLSEGIQLPNSHPLLLALKAVSESRNKLVHPTAIEYHGDEAGLDPLWWTPSLT